MATIDRPPPPERALPAWALALVGWLAGVAFLAGRATPPPDPVWPPPPDCTLESTPPPPAAATPRDWRGAPGLGRRRALQIARALWDAGERDPERVDLEALPGIGPTSAARARAWARAQAAAAPAAR